MNTFMFHQYATNQEIDDIRFVSKLGHLSFVIFKRGNNFPCFEFRLVTIGAENVSLDSFAGSFDKQILQVPSDQPLLRIQPPPPQDTKF